MTDDAWNRAHYERCQAFEREQFREWRKRTDAAVARLTPKVKAAPPISPFLMKAAAYYNRVLQRVVTEREVFGQLRMAHADADIHSEPVLHLHMEGEINADLENEVLAKLRANPSSAEIVVLIHSHGGLAECAHNLFSVLHAHRAQKVAIIII